MTREAEKVLERRGPTKLDLLRDQVRRDFWGLDQPLDLEKNVSGPGDFTGGILAMLEEMRATGIDVEQLRGAWADAAGAFIGANTEPVSIVDGKLTLRVLQPALKFAVNQQLGPLLTKLQGHFGERIQKIAVRIG